MTRDQRASLWIATVACLLLVVAIAPPLMKTARADLPPRPDLPGSSKAKPLAGARILLRATFSPDWPHNKVHWQELWTVVEWQGPEGEWRVVEGWQGTLNDIVVDDDGNVVGEKTWWVYGSNLGQGPFRWLVYEGQGGRLVASSASFDLPTVSGQSLTIEVSPTP